MGAKSQLNGGIFYIIFVAHACFTGIKRQKRSYNMFWKTLAQQEDCMKSKMSRKKVDQMVKIYIKTTKTEYKTCNFQHLH
ncbi:hypothetical protein HT118_14315 [Escherichia coli]|nr:hypothetical protein [Escherichia coli]